MRSCFPKKHHTKNPTNYDKSAKEVELTDFKKSQKTDSFFKFFHSLIHLEPQIKSPDHSPRARTDLGLRKST